MTDMISNKKQVILLLKISILLLLPTGILSQTKGKPLEVTYVLAYKNYQDSTDNDPEILENFQYRLTCNKNEARFEYIPPDLKVEQELRYNRTHGPGPGDKGVYYKNIKENLKLHLCDAPLDKKRYLIRLPFDEYQWVITDETKKIGGYLCYKAYAEYEYEYEPFAYIGKDTTVKVKITVWFTPEINYPFGPEGYDGLPGLVLEKHHSSFYYIASEISFKNDEGNCTSIPKPEGGIAITKTQFEKHMDTLRKKYFEN